MAIKMPRNKSPKKMCERFMFSSAWRGQDNATDTISPTILIDGCGTSADITPSLRQWIREKPFA
jgi:hypothetical protein